MNEDTSKNNDLTAYDDATDGAIRSIISFVIGALVLVLLVGGGVYLFTRYRSSSKTTPNKNVATQSAAPTNKNSGFPKSPSVMGTQSSQQVLTTWKTYQDNTFGYSFRIPSTWEAYRRVNGTNGYQTAVHLTGSKDAPITVNSQKNLTGFSTSEIVSSLYGINYPREMATINGNQAILVKNESVGYMSYFITKNGNLYELSVATLNQSYVNIFYQLITSFNVR